MSHTTNRGLVGVLLLVVIFFVILMAFAFYTIKLFKDSASLEFIEGEGAIAVVEVEGVILDAKKTVENLIKAEKMKNIKAIIVRINTPGGAVGPVQEIYQEIRRIDQTKPVFASFGAIAASGGYYVGAATRRIYANPGTLTGSIGVIMEFVDLSKLYQFAKVSQSSVKSGRFKDLGHPYRGLTDEEKKLMQELISGVHQQFKRDILERRRDKIKGDLGEMAQGQIFSGEDAFKYGLVDEIASLWEAGRKIHTELKLEGEFGLKYIKKRKKFSFMDLIEDIDEVIGRFDLKSLMNNTPILMYLP